MVGHDPQPAYRLERATDVRAETDAEASLDTGELFRRYAPYVAKIGYRLLGRDSDVDDLVQEVFLAAHRGLGSLRDGGAVRGWLATVTVRQARRRLRTRRLRQLLHLDGHHDYDELADDAGTTPEQRAMLRAVYRCLDTLPVNQRLAWSLRYIEGETLERVASLCGCSLATAKRRIKAAHDRVSEEVSRD